MKMTSFYSANELRNIGFASVGENVLLSRKASIYLPEKISIGSNVRIDDFCVISGHVIIGNYVHIATACLLFGGHDGIVFEDYSGLSSRSAVYAESDNYSGCCLTNPMVPMKYRSIIGGGVIIRKHAIIGTGCSIMPGVVIGDGCAVGSMSLVNKSLDDWSIYVGIPCRKIGERLRSVLDLEKVLQEELSKRE